MMPTIDIDEDVFAELQQRARPFIDTPSDVIRALINASHEPSSGDSILTPSGQSRIPDDAMVGKLDGLIKRGLIAPGDKLIHERKRSGEVFEATVSKRGCIVLPGYPYFREPSPALREYTRSQIDGWANWTHVPSGRTLRDLRDSS